MADVPLDYCTCDDPTSCTLHARVHALEKQLAQLQLDHDKLKTELHTQVKNLKLIIDRSRPLVLD